MQSLLRYAAKRPLDDYIAELEGLGGPEMMGLDPLQSQRYAKAKAGARRVVQRIDSHYAFDDLRRSTLAGLAFDATLESYFQTGASSLGLSSFVQEFAERSQSMDSPARGLLNQIVFFKSSCETTPAGNLRRRSLASWVC